MVPDYIGAASMIPSIVLSLIGMGVVLNWMMGDERRWWAIPEMWLLIHVAINGTVFAAYCLSGSPHEWSMWTAIWSGVVRLHVVATMMIYYFTIRGRKHVS